MCTLDWQPDSKNIIMTIEKIVMVIIFWSANKKRLNWQKMNNAIALLKCDGPVNAQFIQLIAVFVKRLLIAASVDMKCCVTLFCRERNGAFPLYKCFLQYRKLQSLSTCTACSTRQAVHQFEAVLLKWEHDILSSALCQPRGFIRYECACQVKKAFVKG